jgi:hypothetical protein
MYWYPPLMWSDLHDFHINTTSYAFLLILLFSED